MAKPGARNHPKFRRLVRLLEEPESHVYGYLHMLWEVGYERGEPRIGDCLDVALACNYPGDPDRIATGLLRCGGDGAAGYTDEVPGEPGRYEIHDLYQHAPEYVVKRRLRDLSKRAGVQVESLREQWKAGQIDIVHPALSQIRQRCRTMSDNGEQRRPLSDNGRTPSPVQPLETETKTEKPSAAAAADAGSELHLTSGGDSQAPTKRRRREKTRPSDPNVPRLIRHYVAEFERTQHATPLIEAADAAAVPKILAGRPFEGERGAAWLVTRFLEDPDSWARERGLLRLRDLPAAVVKILAKSAPTGRPRDLTGAPTSTDREVTEDTVAVDPQGVRRLVRIKRDGRTGTELGRVWGKAVDAEEVAGGQRQPVAAG